MMGVIKKIHYCWFGHAPLPELAIRCIESWKKFCPDYEIIQWNENNFDCNCCDYVREAYERKRWAFVSDYARFWILYNFGGLYFDTDVELIRPIDDLIEKGPFMGMERELDFQLVVENRERLLGVAPGLGLYAPPMLGIYAEILDDYRVRHFINKDGSEDTTTVVNIVSDILKRHSIYRADDISLVTEDVFLYRKDVFCPIDYKTGKMNVTPNTRSIHPYSSSWMTEDERIVQEIYIKSKNKYGEKIGRVIGFVRSVVFQIKKL